jgi:ParB family chromosome partitioning protein
VSKLKGLGTNFESLVPVGVNVEIVSTANEHKIHQLALDVVKPKSDQPRKYFSEIELEKLAQSIKKQGILQPIVVAETEQNSYTIIAGERRWRAAGLAGLSKVPAIIKKVNELEHLQYAVLENVQRQDLNPIEIALSINRLHNEYQQSYEDIALSLGKAYTTIVNTSRLLNLPEVMQESIGNGTLSEGHGRALLALAKRPSLQKKLYTQILQKNLTVRQAESLVSEYKNADTSSNKEASQTNEAKVVKYNQPDTKKLAKKLGLKKVDFKVAKNGQAKLTFTITDNTQLEKINKLFSLDS